MPVLPRYKTKRLTVADLFAGYANLNRADFNHYYLGAITHRCAVDYCTLTTELTKKHTVFEQ